MLSELAVVEEELEAERAVRPALRAHPGAACSYPVFADLVRDFEGARFQLKRVHASGL